MHGTASDVTGEIRLGWMDEIEEREAQSQRTRMQRIQEFAREVDAMVTSDLSGMASKAFADRYTVSGPRTHDLLEGDVEWIAESIDKRHYIGEGFTPRWIRVSIMFDHEGVATRVYVSTSGVAVQQNPNWGRSAVLDGELDQQTLRDVLFYMHRAQPPK